MPHVIVKMHPGRSEQQKAKLAEAITQQVMAIARVGADAVSVAIEEVNATEWAERVYRPDILGHPERLYKKPGYDPFAQRS
jgi:4-oxalocrotonate tautomerase